MADEIEAKKALPSEDVAYRLREYIPGDLGDVHSINIYLAPGEPALMKVAYLPGEGFEEELMELAGNFEVVGAEITESEEE